jgi:uncharacterized protein YfdQ (DUF2303 family)
MSVELKDDSALMTSIIAAATSNTALRTAPDGSSYLVHPDGTQLAKFPAVNPVLPGFITATERFLDVVSFGDYVNDFKDGGSKMLCDITSREVDVVLDYHTGGEGKENAPRRRMHHAILKPQLSVEWKAWDKINEKLLSQHEFGEFLEENAVDIASPDAASILEIVMGLQVKKVIDHDSAINLGNGMTQFRYSEEGTTKVKNKEITVPTKILVRIPVFVSGTGREIEVLFRYRADGGSLKFMVKIVRREQVLLDAFQQIVGEASVAADMTPLFTV